MMGKFWLLRSKFWLMKGKLWLPNMSAPPRRCWVGNAASSVCAVGQRTHPAEVQSEPHPPSDVVLGQLVTERIGLEIVIVLAFSS